MEKNNIIYQTNKGELLRDKYIFPIVFILVPLLMGGIAGSLAIKENRLSSLIGFFIVLLIIVSFCLVIFIPQLLFYKSVTITEEEILFQGKRISWENVVSVTPHFTTCLKINFREEDKIRCLMVSNSNWLIGGFYKNPYISDFYLRLKCKIKQ